MSVVRAQARQRWCLVAAGVAAACAAPAIVAVWPPAVAPVSAAQLRASILASVNTPYQGYAQSDAALGLPSLPGLSDLAAILDGVTRTRVWHASASRWRVDVLSDVGERDTYGSARGTFTWDSGNNLLTEIIGMPAFRLPRAADLTPPALAQRVLRDAGAGSRITGLAAKRVAGRNAAGLRVIPAGQASTIGQVDIWADPGTGLPLQVEVFGRGSGRPALVSEFLQVSPSRTGRRVLTPVRGPGTGFTMTDAQDIVEALGHLPVEPLPGSLAGRSRIPPPPGSEGIGAYGRGLSTFGVLPLPLPMGLHAIDAARKAGGVSVALPHGSGILISTPLLTVMIAQRSLSPDTFVLAGLVNASLLKAAGAQLLAWPDPDLHGAHLGRHVCRISGPRVSCRLIPVPGRSNR